MPVAVLALLFAFMLGIVCGILGARARWDHPPRPRVALRRRHLYLVRSDDRGRVA